MLREAILRRLTQLPGVRTLWTRLPIGSVPTRERYGGFPRAHYAFGVFHAADAARRLRIKAITVIEFGVAGGNGLVALERLAAAVSGHFGIHIDVCGFDSGEGMPAPIDYRDLPHMWDAGFFKMDIPLLKSRLSPQTELVLGSLEKTLPAWRPRSPIGFIAFDLDYYSSTTTALKVFDIDDPMSRLPRVLCYFDDLIKPEYVCANEYIGELLAIKEFNDSHAHKKVCPLHLLRHVRPHAAPWNDQIYALSDFQHPLYCVNLTAKVYSELPLEP